MCQPSSGKAQSVIFSIIFICFGKFWSAALNLRHTPLVSGQDVRYAEYSKEAVTEYIRDTIANINGIYYVVSIGEAIFY